MARNQPQAPKLERPCANPECNHVHEGACGQDGCKCQASVAPGAVDNRADEEPPQTSPTLAAVLPPEERIANVLEDVEEGIEVGCELTVDGQKFTWTGEKMELAKPAPKLSEAEAAKLRSFFISHNPAEALPDGSIRMPIIVPAEMAEVLKSWAEGAGEEWQSYLQKMVEQGLNAIVFGGAVAG